MPRPPLASLASCFEVEELVCGQRLCGDGAMLQGHGHGGPAGALRAEPGIPLALVGTGWGRSLDEGLTPCARPAPPPAPGQAATGRGRYSQTKKRGLEAGPAWPPQLPAQEASPAWGTRVGAPTVCRPLPRAVLFVLPAAQSQPLHAHLVSRPHRLCQQTYLQFDHLAPPWLLPHLCPVLLQSLLSAQGAGSDHAWPVLHAVAGTTTPNKARWGPSPLVTSLSSGCKPSFLTWCHLPDLYRLPGPLLGLLPPQGLCPCLENALPQTSLGLVPQFTQGSAQISSQRPEPGIKQHPLPSSPLCLSTQLSPPLLHQTLTCSFVCLNPPVDAASQRAGCFLLCSQVGGKCPGQGLAHRCSLNTTA